MAEITRDGPTGEFRPSHVRVSAANRPQVPRKLHQGRRIDLLRLQTGRVNDPRSVYLDSYIGFGLTPVIANGP